MQVSEVAEVAEEVDLEVVDIGVVTESGTVTESGIVTERDDPDLAALYVRQRSTNASEKVLKYWR